MARIVNVIDPATGTGQGFLVNDSLSDTIGGLEEIARRGDGLDGAGLRALLADLEGQAGLIPTSDRVSTPELDEAGNVVPETRSPRDESDDSVARNYTDEEYEALLAERDDLLSKVDGATGTSDGTQAELDAVKAQAKEAVDQALERIRELETQVGTLTEEKATLEALLNDETGTAPSEEPPTEPPAQTSPNKPGKADKQA